MATSPPLTASLNYTIAVISAYGEFYHVPLTRADIEYQFSHYHQSRVGGLIAGVVIMLVVTTAAVALRLLSRRAKRVHLGADDYIAIIGLVMVPPFQTHLPRSWNTGSSLAVCVRQVFFYGYVTSYCVLIHYGLGLHTIRAGAYNFTHIGLPFYVYDILYGSVCFTTKMSVLFLYRRVFTITNRAWQISFWTIVGLFSAWAIASTFKDVFEAIPPRAVWELVPGAKWIDTLNVFLITGLINAVLTMAIIILPMPLVWEMQMSRMKRIGLCAVFAIGCGCVTIEFSLLDLGVIIARSIMVRLEHFPSTDFSWDVTTASTLAVIEQALGILCASLPMTCSVIVRTFKPRKVTTNYPLSDQKKSPWISTPSSNPSSGFQKVPESHIMLTDSPRGDLTDEEKMFGRVIPSSRPPQEV